MKRIIFEIGKWLMDRSGYSYITAVRVSDGVHVYVAAEDYTESAVLTFAAILAHVKTAEKKEMAIANIAGALYNMQDELKKDPAVLDRIGRNG